MCKWGIKLTAGWYFGGMKQYRIEFLPVLLTVNLNQVVWIRWCFSSRSDSGLFFLLPKKQPPKTLTLISLLLIFHFASSHTKPWNPLAIYARTSNWFQKGMMLLTEIIFLLVSSYLFCAGIFIILQTIQYFKCFSSMLPHPQRHKEKPLNKIILVAHMLFSCF